MKKTVLALAIVTASSSAVAGWTTPDNYSGWTSADGSLTIGGDAEMNFDAINNSNGVKGASIPSRDDRGLTNTQLADDSRILMRVDWRNAREDGSFVSARIEPLMKANGTLEMDDAFFAFGVEESWMFQIGRYEAMDLFPVGRDIALFYAAGSDGIGSGVYYYMAKEARGRNGEAGQARVAGQFGNWTAEVSTVYGDTSEILSGSSAYLSDVNEISSRNNSFIVRPAINYLSDDGTVSISFGGEFEAQSNSVIVTNGAGTEFDLSDRYGLSATATLTFGDLLWHNSAAYQDAKQLWKAETFNSNIEYKAFGLGASYARNRHIEDTRSDTTSFAIYTSYTVPVLDFQNAEVIFALSHSETENAYGTKDNDEKTTAFRTRFNYYF